jgi:rhodanese-related sulfurtransferase
MAIGEISVEELDDRRAAGAVLFDVRESDEYNEAHVPGAVLVPLSELPSRVTDFPPSHLPNRGALDARR